MLIDISPTRKNVRKHDIRICKRLLSLVLSNSASTLPEQLIGADRWFYLKQKMGSGSAGLTPFSPEALAKYERCFSPDMIHASCEDYRAAATIDLEHDRLDIVEKHRIACFRCWCCGETRGHRALFLSTGRLGGGRGRRTGTCSARWTLPGRGTARPGARRTN